MKNKKFDRIVVAILIFAMVAIYGSVPTVKAASLATAKDVLSTSAPAISAVHTITASTTQAIPNNGYISITLQGGSTFGAIATGTCSNGGAVSTTTPQTLRCTYGSGLATSTSFSITVTDTNPAAAGTYTVTVGDYTNGSVLLESANLIVAIVNQVTMTATVPATLTFTVAGTSTGATINGITTTATSTATSTPFGTLTVGATSTVGQSISVTTNAASGFAVTVQENQEMTNAAGANINSFDNSITGFGSTTPHAWNDPTGILGNTNTYGHMGLTSDDATNGSGPNFTAANKYAGLNGTAPMQVMYNSGPSDGSTAGVGLANVAYSVKITALQEAGDYTNTLTYICTPTY